MNQTKENQEMEGRNLVSNTEAREFVRRELVWVANFLREKYGFNVNEVRRFLREMIDVSV